MDQTCEARTSVTHVRDAAHMDGCWHTTPHRIRCSRLIGLESSHAPHTVSTRLSHLEDSQQRTQSLFQSSYLDLTCWTHVIAFRTIHARFSKLRMYMPLEGKNTATVNGAVTPREKTTANKCRSGRGCVFPRTPGEKYFKGYADPSTKKSYIVNDEWAHQHWQSNAIPYRFFLNHIDC